MFNFMSDYLYWLWVNWDIVIVGVYIGISVFVEWVLVKYV